MHCTDVRTIQAGGDGRSTKDGNTCPQVRNEKAKGGCYGSSDLVLVAYKRSWSQKFCENSVWTANTESAASFSPQFDHSGVGVVVCCRFVQTGSPLRPNRAALRAAQGFAPSLLARLTRNHQLLWGKITVVDEKERLTPDTCVRPQPITQLVRLSDVIGDAITVENVHARFVDKLQSLHRVYILPLSPCIRRQVVENLSRPHAGIFFNNLGFCRQCETPLSATGEP